ncbi:histone H3/H4 [Anoxybacillus tepidamans]|uniref:Histone H3/H4 n=1 Tax=Anoxybacteroides tepidamans TaxID=265948 RepID=A0A7W8MUS6_9BACL|nr:transcriptional regulator [Anoxybacillus tepidamans]MBB5323516.1 histone H3/H4 [Anoxybacillus tepidamans]
MAEGISYQAKDILFKSLSELYENQALEVYGLHDLSKIKQLLPNEYPMVRADEKRSDTLFLLEDGSILMLEYESNSRVVENHLKYLDYAYRILYKYYKEQKQIKHIRIVVIYTSDVTNAKELLHAGDVKVSSKAVLLCEYNGDAVLHTIEKKIRQNKTLTLEETMKLILVPLMHSKHDRQTMIEKTISLTKEINDEQTQLHVIAGILTATDKFIDEEYAKKIKEWIKMTKVLRLFEQEKEEAVKKAAEEAAKKAAEEAMKKATEEAMKKAAEEAKKAAKHTALEIAKNLLDILPITEIAKRTGLSIDEVAELAKETKN